jgi:hypothetical protein
VAAEFLDLDEDLGQLAVGNLLALGVEAYFVVLASTVATCFAKRAKIPGLHDAKKPVYSSCPSKSFIGENECYKENGHWIHLLNHDRNQRIKKEVKI